MILDDLILSTKKNLQHRQDKVSLDDLKSQLKQVSPINSKFISDLQKPEMTIIAEIKQASPSKGQIVKISEFDYQKIAVDYTKAKVDMISVLTEEDYFKGSLDILRKVVQSTNLPVLRKDFTIDPYMIYEAKVFGASAILLIVAILTDSELKDFLKLSKELGLIAIVEAHDETEVQRAIKAGATIIGVNNRNLKNFTVDFHNTEILRKRIPQNISVISESGIKSRQDVETLEKIKVNGILVGETFMKAPDRIAMIQELRGF